VFPSLKELKGQKELHLLLMVQKSGEKTTVWMYINHVNNGINYLSTDAGFLPSTVCIVIFRDF